MGRQAFDAFWAELSPCAHVVQIYEDDALFLDNLAEFVAGGLKLDEAVIVIATPQHREGLRKRLTARGIDVAGARSRDQLIVLDAQETMSQFLVDTWPDDELFKQAIGSVLDKATRNGRKVRAFGEMVALMWAQGFCGATIRLEHLWTDLCRSRAFSLFCAYPKTGFTANAADDIARVCALHSTVHEAHGT
jgi:hypothetical protein